MEALTHLRAAVLQLDPEHAPRLEELPERLDPLADQGVDLIVLPELWNAIFAEGRLRRGALPDDPAALEPLLRWSRSHPELLLCPGSLPVALDGDDHTLANRCWLIQSGRVLACYDKMHLFGPMGEPAWVRPGGRPCVAGATVRGQSITVGLAICYDLRFPELFRDLAARGAELMLLPAQWPRKRHFAFHHLMRARAIENGVTLLGVNRGGVSGGTTFVGGSACYGMGDGQVFLEPCYERESAQFTIDLAAVRRERAQLDAVADRRYQLIPPEER